MCSFGRITKLVVNIDQYSTQIIYENSTIRNVYSNPSGFVFRSGAASLNKAATDGHCLDQATAFLVHHFCDDSAAAVRLLDGKHQTTDDDETGTETENCAIHSELAETAVPSEHACFLELIPIVEPQRCNIVKQRIGKAKVSHPVWHLRSCILHEYASHVNNNYKCYCVSIAELMDCINGWSQGINHVDIVDMSELTYNATNAQDLNIYMIYLNAQLKRFNYLLHKQAKLNKLLLAKIERSSFH